MTNPALARSTPFGRIYVHPVTGEQVPSITTIISGGVPKPALIGWAAKTAAAYAVDNWDQLAALDAPARLDVIKGAHRRTRDRAADLGDAVHAAVESWCADAPMPDWPAAVEPFMVQFVEFLAAREPDFLHNEITVWNRTHGYAGTLDWIAVLGGHTTLGDTKSGKAVYPEVALQLTALSRAEFIVRPDGTEHPLPDIERCGVLHLRPRSWALIPVATGEENWRAFLAAREITLWSRDTAPAVLGPRLQAAA